MTLFPALFSHYRRHPLQLLALALMIVVATMLWTGVSHLTNQARDSLGQSEQAVAERRQVQRADGEPVTVDDFVRLRRAGLCVMPWLEVSQPAPMGQVVGIDPLATSCFADDQPGESRWEQPLNGKPFLDIAEAAAIADADSDHSAVLFLLIADSTAHTELPAGYRLTAFSLGPDTGELGESFLLNLDALGVLVLLITALLLRSVYQLGMVQRRASFALLYRFGVLPAAVNRVLVLEILGLATLCVLPGVWLGRLLAGGLGSGFGQALDGLFDIPLYAGQGESWLVPMLTMLAVVSAVCLADRARPLPRARLAARSLGWLALSVLLSGLALALLAASLEVLFVAVALVFVGTGLIVPKLLAAWATWQARRQSDPLIRWRHQEFGVLARRLALPLVALKFALAMVLAVQALVTVFESTFEHWLGQRLAADYYIEVPAGADSAEATAWLGAQPELVASGEWHRVVRSRARIEGSAGFETAEQSIDLLAVAPVGPLIREWDLQASSAQPWQALAAGEAMMVNEQLARRMRLATGDTLTLTLGDRRLALPVVAIYPDYGRPAGEVLLSAGVLPAGLSIAFESLSVSPGILSIEQITEGLKQVWQTDTLTVRDNRRIQELAETVFDQTFLLTRAITTVTLSLAALALLVMGWVLFSTRAWYFQLLAVWGLRRRAVFAQLLRLTLALTAAVACLALPLGIWLTWVLVQRINPLAFGWSLPMELFPGFWLELVALSLGIGLSIALLMARQLRKPSVMPVSASHASGGER